MNYEVIPRAVFIDSEYARVGLTEKELHDKIGRCSCRTVSIADAPKAHILGNSNGLVKMVIDPTTRIIRGVHMLAPGAVDAIHEAALAIKKNMTIDELIETIHVFPTISEGIKYAALAFSRDFRKMPCCLL